MSLESITTEQILEWAYSREKVHRAREPGFAGLMPCRPPSHASVSSSERLGEGGGTSRNLGFEAPADAYAVAAAVQALAPHVARVLVEQALTGVRPDWTPRPVIYAEPGRSGNSLHIDGKGRRYHCAFRMFSYRGDLPEIIAERRKRYAIWARGVAAVYARLSRAGVLTN